MFSNRISRVRLLFSLFIASLLLLLALPGTALAHGGGHHRDRQRSRMFVFGAPDQLIPGGLARLEREDDGVELTVRTRMLVPGNVYTVWWVVFNNPEYCTAPCGSDDLPFNGGSAAIESSMLWGAGNIARHNGRISFSGELEESDPPGQVVFGPGLVDASKAELHIVIRDHGPVVPDLLEDQLSTFAGGCNNQNPAFGTPGDYACSDVQAAIFLPTGGGSGSHDND